MKWVVQALDAVAGWLVDLSIFYGDDPLPVWRDWCYRAGCWLYGKSGDLGVTTGALVRNPHPCAGQTPHPIWIWR